MDGWMDGWICIYVHASMFFAFVCRCGAIHIMNICLYMSFAENMYTCQFVCGVSLQIPGLSALDCCCLAVQLRLNPP